MPSMMCITDDTKDNEVRVAYRTMTDAGRRQCTANDRGKRKNQVHLEFVE